MNLIPEDLIHELPRSIAFRDNVHAGEFAKSFKASLVANADSNIWAHALDCSIYTTNRLFRLVHSEKVGRNNPLRYVRGPALRGSAAEQVLDSMVTLVPGGRSHLGSCRRCRFGFPKAHAAETQTESNRWFTCVSFWHRVQLFGPRVGPRAAEAGEQLESGAGRLLPRSCAFGPCVHSASGAQQVLLHERHVAST